MPVILFSYKKKRRKNYMEIKKTGRYVKDDNNFLNFDELSVTIKEAGEKIKVTKEVFGFLKRDIWRLDVQSRNLRKRQQA